MKDIALKNINDLKTKKYIGRGIIIGQLKNSKNIVHIYWIMGRSENSKNRIFHLEKSNYVLIKPFNINKLEDPSLIIYYPIKQFNNFHIISNGDHTDTVFEYLKNNNSFDNAILSRKYEPDAPNFTPRIAGLTDIKNNQHQLAIVKTINNNPDQYVHNFYKLPKLISGFGFFISTYEDDGNPLPSFQGEPKIVPIFDDLEENLNYYWDLLNEEYKISILAKKITLKNEVGILIKNKLF